MQSTGGILPQLVSPVSLSPTPKTSEPPHAGAQAFEGMLSSMLIKQMRQSLTSNSLCGHDKSDALGGLFDHFMGERMASKGGLGIGAMIRRQLEIRSPSNDHDQPEHPHAIVPGTAIPLHRTTEPRAYPLDRRGAVAALRGYGPAATYADLAGSTRAQTELVTRIAELGRRRREFGAAAGGLLKIAPDAVTLPIAIDHLPAVERGPLADELAKARGTRPGDRRRNAPAVPLPAHPSGRLPTNPPRSHQHPRQAPAATAPPATPNPSTIGP